MNAKVFNACLLAGWFLLTLGGVLFRPEVGLMVGGLALIVLTLAIAVRFGVYDQESKPAKATDAAAAS